MSAGIMFQGNFWINNEIQLIQIKNVRLDRTFFIFSEHQFRQFRERDRVPILLL